MAKLVDAHASGACWLSQWKFESSSGHHKKILPCGGFFYGVLKIRFSNFHGWKFDYKRHDYKRQAYGGMPVALPAAQWNEQCTSIVEDSLLQGTIQKKAPNGAFFCMVKRFVT